MRAAATSCLQDLIYYYNRGFISDAEFNIGGWLPATKAAEKFDRMSAVSRSEITRWLLVMC